MTKTCSPKRALLPRAIWPQLPLLVLLGACNKPVSGEPKPVAVPAQTAPAQAAPAPQPTPPTRADASRWTRGEERDAKGEPLVVWSYHPDTSPAGEAAHADADQLVPTRLGLDRANLSIGLRFAAAERGRPAASARPQIALEVDGCPAPAPRMNVAALANDGAEGRLSVARSDLPRGDLHFVFSAFDSEFSLYLRHDDEGVEPITARDQKHVLVRPGDPDAGIPDTISYAQPDCQGVKP